MESGEQPPRPSTDDPPDEAPPPPPAPPPALYGPLPPAYPPPYPYAPPQQTNGFAVASLVLGIIWIYWVGSILALVFGYIAKRQIDGSEGRQSGRGLAIAGIVLGWVGVGVLAIIAVIIVAAVASEA